MADIAKIDGDAIADIAKIMGDDKGDIAKFLGADIPEAQADPALTSLTNEDFNASTTFGNATAYNPTDKIMIFSYGDSANSGYPTVVCATASGSTLTYGDEVVIVSTADSFSSGVTYNDEQDRVMGAYMVYEGSDYNSVYAYAASITTSGSGSPKLSSVGTSTVVYNPNSDGSSFPNLHGPEGQMCIYDHSDGASAGRMLVFFAKGGESSGSSVAGDRSDVVGAAVTITDVSSNNNVTVGALQVLQDVNGYSTDPPMIWSWNEQRNKVVLVTQDVSGTFQVQAATVTGSGATMTVNTQYLLDTGAAQALSHNTNFGYDGTNKSRFRMDNTKRVVYDSTNNCHHVYIYQQKYGTQSTDDFSLFNFTVAANDTITWTQTPHNAKPVKSSGIIKQSTYLDGGNGGTFMTNGNDASGDFGGTSTKNNISLAFSAGRGRGAIFGHNSSHTSDADVNVMAWGYTAGEGYSFKGGKFEMFTNKPKSQVTSPSGTTHLSDDGFVGSNLFFVGDHQDNNGESEIGAFDTGIGLTAPGNAIFSRGDSELPAQRSRLAGFGQSRIAALVIGGNNTGGTPQVDGDEYNGNVFTASGNLSVARHSASGSGTLTAGFIFGGTGTDGHGASASAPKTSEEYDGSSFSTGGTSSSIGGDGISTTGLQTDTLGVGGYISAYRDDVESYNGSSWSTEADSPVNLNYGRMAGRSHNDAIHFGGHAGSYTKPTYKYNGSAWSTLNSMINDNNVFQAFGITTDAGATGGNRIDNGASEFWDGTSWASGPTNSYFDRYAPTNSIDCNGTFAGISFGGGTGSSNGAGDVQNMHCDR
mgnify:CR=1 FL=1|tara:strand:+ start:1604 stop:4042 length:2439 start_codon:yes stop_codon:yes gene_type:complete